MRRRTSATPPKTLEQRVAIANDFVKRFRYDVRRGGRHDYGANAAYAAWPERFYIIDESGLIAFKGKPGPFGFSPRRSRVAEGEIPVAGSAGPLRS